MSELIHRNWDALTTRLGWGQDKPVTVANYTGFGRPDFLYLTGRVLREKAISRSERDGLLKNFIKNFRRFNSREIPAAVVKVEWGSEVFELQTDAEGYFKIDQTFSKAISTSAGVTALPDLWQEAKITVLSIPGQPEVNYEAFSDVIIPDLSQAEYGIISDIDDTVLQTDVTSLLKLRAMLHTILKNAGSRVAFEQVAEFYQALQLGPDGEGHNPCFYVSNSPWNLYDLLKDFLQTNGLPRGPIMLRDFGLPYEEKEENYRGHKAEMVDRILRTYPGLPFILIGDSGEHDLDIYLAAAKKYPDQIQQIYIRDVQHTRRAQRITQLIENQLDVSAKLVASYAEAQVHAKENGLI